MIFLKGNKIGNRFKKGHEINLGRKGFWAGKKRIFKNPIERALRISKAQKKIGNRPPSMFGKKMTEETKRKIGDSHRGKKSYMWKGGISPKDKKIRKSIEFRLWREVIFVRDYWTCQKYGIKGGRLHPHHIQNFAQYPELRFAIDNGVTLSEKAHKEFHKKYGTRNNTKEQLEEFLYGK